MSVIRRSDFNAVQVLESRLQTTISRQDAGTGGGVRSPR